MPPPGGLSTSSRPPSASTRSTRPLQPGPELEVGAADAVVGDLDAQAVAGGAGSTRAVLARAYLATLVSASATT